MEKIYSLQYLEGKTNLYLGSIPVIQYIKNMNFYKHSQSGNPGFISLSIKANSRQKYLRVFNNYENKRFDIDKSF